MLIVGAAALATVAALLHSLIQSTQGPSPLSLFAVGVASFIFAGISVLARIDSRRALVQAVTKRISKASLLASSDIFAFPSSLEGFGFAVTEPIASGKLVVGYSNPTSLEIVDDSGMLVSEEDGDAFAEAVIFLATHPGEAIELGLAGRHRIETQFDWGSTGNLVCCVFDFTGGTNHMTTFEMTKSLSHDGPSYSCTGLRHSDMDGELS